MNISVKPVRRLRAAIVGTERALHLAMAAMMMCLACLAVAPGTVHAASVPELITLDMPATGDSSFSSISGDGRYVAFVHSYHPTPKVFQREVYVHDRATQSKKLISVGANGEPSNGHNLFPRISTDGRYIAFQTLGSNLVPGKPSGIYVYDQSSQALEWIASGDSIFGISSDGRYIAYRNDLYKPGTSILIGTGLFVHDRISGIAEQLNVPLTVGGGRQGDQLSISDDGRFIAYAATRRLGDDSEGIDAFVYDRTTQSSEQINIGVNGGSDYGTFLSSVSMSGDGRYVAFAYSGGAMVAKDTNRSWDVFVRDRLAGTTERASVFDDGSESTTNNQMAQISADGRHVAFVAHENLDPASGVDGSGIFVRDLIAKTTRRAAVSGSMGLSASRPSISADGRYVSYDHYSTSYMSGNVAVTRLGTAAGIALSAAELALVEGGASSSYSLALSGAPSADVIVTVGSNAQLSATPAQLIFTPGNWETPQTVSVSAVQDGVTEGDHSTKLTHTIAGADPAYSGIQGGSVQVAITEATMPVITSPQSSGPASTSATLPVSGTAAPRASVALTATNTQTGDVRALNVMAGADGVWSVSLTGLADGAYTLLARASGIDGNSVTVVVDATAPAVSASFDAGSNRLTIQAQDAGTGIESIETSLDGKAWLTYAAALSFTQDGSVTVHYRARDRAGNVSGGQTSFAVVTLPVLHAPADQSAAEATSAMFNLGSFSDQSADGPWTVEVDWGDGTAHHSASLAATGAIGPLPHHYANSGLFTGTVKITDRAGSTSSQSFKVSVSNVAPTATLQVAAAINEGGSTDIVLGNPYDPSSADTQAGLRFAFSCNGASLAGATYASAVSAGTVTCSYADGPGAVTVRARILDQDGGFSEYTSELAIRNLPASIGAIAAPGAPVQINTSASISAPFTDAGVADSHTATVDWGDGNVTSAAVTGNLGTGSVAGSHSYAVPGLYTVKLTVTDKDGGTSAASYQSIVVIDPSGGSFDGKGAFASNVGAMPGSANAAGVANVQVRADYKKLALIGAMSFDFAAGKLQFQSSAVEWMVIKGDMATLRGTGTINGNGHYGFTVTVIDGGKTKKTPDHIRVKLWDLATGTMVYDNQNGASDTAPPTTELSTGKFTVN